MGRTTFESSVRSRGGRREDDGVSTGGMLMSVVVSTEAGSGTRALKIGGNPLVGENVVLPKGSVIISYQRLSPPDTTGTSILLGTADDPDAITLVNLNLSLGNNATVELPDGALVNNPTYLANGLPDDTPIFATGGVTPPTLRHTGILTYMVYDDGISGNR